MKTIKAIVLDAKNPFFKVPTIQEYNRCLKEQAGYYDRKKIQSKPHGNKKSS